MKKSFSAFKAELLVLVHVAAAAARVLVFCAHPARLCRLRVVLAHVLGQLVVRIKRIAAHLAGQEHAEFFQHAMIK
jgi:hypothetical protein